MSFTSFGNRTGATARKEKFELHYVFDFDDAETVLYTGAGPFPGRVFVLRFWRHAKDGVMSLLGYEKDGHWRDPTRCYPDSYVRYHRRQHPLAHPPLAQPGGAAGREQPQDTTQHRPQPVEQLAYRVPLLELDHGVWELPTLKGKPVHLIGNVRRFPKPPKAAVTIRFKTPPPPPLNKPVDRVIEFVSMSTHFEHPSQAEQELDKLLKVLKQFPQLQVTIQGNYQMAPGYLVRGYGPYPSYEQERRLSSPYVTKWPHEVESYTSIGQIMDSRARAIQQYLIRHGISARRVHTSRGQFSDKKTFTIIFSN